MLNFVLFVICIGAALATAGMQYRALQIAHRARNAEFSVRQATVVWAIVAALYAALLLVGASLDMQAAFTPMVMISFIATTLSFGWQSLRDARQPPYLPE